ncbi:hypothetical protein ACH4OW_29455 [Streptomyces sp. NPDC017056]|uniref:LppU/SCO3897 family protein n=1 Tax=Streptomyces sp. NPDC017056 TaxID=3364973 RepID=UPI00378AEA9E
MAAFLAVTWFIYDSKTGDMTVLQVGDCFKNTGSMEKPRPEKLGCAETGADYSVVKVVEDGVSGILECADAPAATGSLTQAGTTSRVVCFKANATANSAV